MKFVAALLAVLLLTGAGPVPAQRIGLHIRISTMGDHLRAHFHADMLVAEIVMDDRVREEETAAQLRAVRLRQWRPVGSGWLPYGGRLARQDGQVFQDADLDLFPDDMPVVWGDPMVFPAGGGFVVHSRYLLADPLRFDTIVDYRSRPEELLYTGGSGPAALQQRDFAHETYLGPAASLSGDPQLHIIAGRDVPGWAQARVSAQAVRSMQFFQARLGQPLPWPPTLIMAALPEPLDRQGARMIGKATSGGVLTFRFFGAGSLSETEGGRADLDHIAAHEVFHFWDSSISKMSNGADHPWLAEGGADYAALLARRALGQLEGPRWYREFDRRLESCRVQLQGRGLTETTGEERHRVAYPCGVVIQWICDMAIQHATHQQNGVFDLWRTLLAQARVHGGFYRLEDFRAALAAYDPSALATVDLLLSPDPGDRWKRLKSQMEVYGVRTAPALQTEQEARIALLRHLILADCTGADTVQVTERSAGFLLTFHQSACHHLDGSPEIRAIEGYSLRLDVYLAHSAMMQKCASGKVVDVTLSSGRTIGVVCGKPMSPLAQSKLDFDVIGMP